MNRRESLLTAATPLYGGNADFVEKLYESYLSDSDSVSPAWREYFAGLADGAGKEVAHGAIRDQIEARAHSPRRIEVSDSAMAQRASAKQGAVSRLIQVYANRAHLIANIDPLGLQQRVKPYVLDLEYFGLSDADLDSEFFTGSRSTVVPSGVSLAVVR